MRISRGWCSPEDGADGGFAQELLTQLAPIPFTQLDVVLLRRGRDAFPGCVAFRVGHALDLLETGDCAAHVSRVMDGLFTFLGESEVCVGKLIALIFRDLGHATLFANRGPIYARHRGNALAPPVDSSKASSSTIVTVAPVCLAFVAGTQRAHAAWTHPLAETASRAGAVPWRRASSKERAYSPAVWLHTMPRPNL